MKFHRNTIMTLVALSQLASAQTCEMYDNLQARGYTYALFDTRAVFGNGHAGLLVATYSPTRQINVYYSISGQRVNQLYQRACPDNSSCDPLALFSDLLPRYDQIWVKDMPITRSKMNEAISQREMERYNLIFNNCAQAVTRVINAAVQQSQRLPMHTRPNSLRDALSRNGFYQVR